METDPAFTRFKANHPSVSFAWMVYSGAVVFEQLSGGSEDILYPGLNIMGGAQPRGLKDVGMGIALAIWPIEDAPIAIEVAVGVDLDMGIDICIAIGSCLFTIPDTPMLIELLEEPMGPCIPRFGPACRM